MNGFSLFRAYCNLQLPSRPVSPHSPQPFTVTPGFGTPLSQTPIKHVWAVRPCLSESARPAPLATRCHGSGPQGRVRTLPLPPPLPRFGRQVECLAPVGSHVLIIIDQLQVEKSFVLFFKTIVFNALIPNILLSRLSDEQKCIFFRIFETVYDWSISPWRNNLDIPWCNNLVITLMT